MMENQKATLLERVYKGDDKEYLVGTEKPSKFKGAIIISIATFFAGVFGYLMVSLIIGKGNYMMIALTIISGLLYLSFIILETIFLHDAISPIISSIAQSLVLITTSLILVKNIPFVLIIEVLFVMMILFAWAEYSGRAELENTIKIRFSVMSRLVLRKSFIAIAIFIAITYGFAANPSGVISSSVTKIAINTTSFVLGYYISGFNSGMKIEEIVSDLALQKINKEAGGAANIRELSVSDRQKIIADASKTVKQSLESSLGIKLDLKKTFSETVTENVGDKVKQFTENISHYRLSEIFVTVEFLIMIVFGFLIYWIVGLTAFFIYQAFLVTGFATLILETKSKETVILK